LSINKRLTDRETLRIVAISDWHLGFGTSLRQLQKNVDRINAEHPDVILIAGDLVDNSVTPVAENAMDKELKRLHAPLGIYMAPGNHDYISNINRCKDFIAQTNIQLLIDSAVALPCGLTIVGRDDRHNAGRLSAREWRTLIDPAGASVVIDHQPKGIDELQTIGAFLQVSGHTHHGQVIPFKWLTNYLFDISYGHVADNNTHIYVSSGISLWGPPFRIGTHNEIVVFECKFVDAK
jgi:predicted MPP superfamily phosphohydrolase